MWPFLLKLRIHDICPRIGRRPLFPYPQHSAYTGIRIFQVSFCAIRRGPARKRQKSPQRDHKMVQVNRDTGALKSRMRCDAR